VGKINIWFSPELKGKPFHELVSQFGYNAFPKRIAFDHSARAQDKFKVCFAVSPENVVK